MGREIVTAYTLSRGVTTGGFWAVAWWLGGAGGGRGGPGGGQGPPSEVF